MEKSENTQNRFWKYIRSLIEPPPNITDIRQRHQARLLSALLLFIIVLGGFSGTIQLLTVPGFFPTFIAILAGVIILCFAYFLAHTKNYLFAATLTALTPLIASYAALLENTEDQSAFTFMLISVLLSSMLLNRWLTLSVAFLNLLGLVLLPVIQPAWTIEIMSGKVSFHIMISALILIAMWQRDLIERDRQRELSESELKFRSIFDYSVDAIGVAKDGVHIMANPAYVRMFGCVSADSLVGSSILDLIAPSERARIQENIRRRSVGEDVPAMYETRGLRCDGTEFDMEVHVSTYELEGKLYIVPILRDITERKKAEEALRASEKAYKLLFGSNPQPMWVYDTNSLAFLAVNDEAVSRYGYSREEFLRMTIKDIRPKDDIPRLMENIAHLSGGLDHAGDWRHIKKDGSLIDIEVTSHFLPFEGKQAELVVTNDITARKAAEKALRESELRYRAIVENSTDLICRSLPDTTLTFVNNAYCRYFGQSRDRLVGTRFLSLIPETDWAGVQEHIASVIRNREPVTYSHEVITPHGEIRWQQWTDSTILNEDRDISELQSVGRDITEQKRAEVEREKLIHELEAKNIEAETLRESAASVALSLDLKETASRILDQLQRVVPYDSASVQLLFGNELQIVDGRGFPEGKDPTGMRFLFDQYDPAYPILNDGSPYILYSNVQEVSDSFKEYFHHHIFSWIAIPLHARGRLIGILTLDGFSPDKFTEEHAHFASTFANQVAVTLENSHLYTDLQKELGERQKAEKELRQREVILAAVAASAELLLKTSNWKVIINDILEKLGWTINASHAYLFEAHPGPEGDILLSIRHEWSAPSFVSDLDNSLYHNMPLHEPGLERWHELVVLRNQPFVGDIVKSSPLEMEILNARGIKAIVEMPIVVNGKWWGVIGFDDMLNDREWNNVEIDALKVAANVLSSAIQRQLYDIALMDELHKRKKLIEELEHKNAELERFTYTVSHDLKSPLVTIKGFLGYIQQDIASGNAERLNNDLERIGNATKKMEKLLRDLLELSRIGRLVKPSEEVSFEDLVREALEIVHGQLVTRGVTVQVQPNLPIVYGDRLRLVEVLQNLLDNAAKYMGDQADPLVDFGLRGREDNEFIFYVRDNGIGIVPQHHERVFGLFNKLDVHSEGTGVGLTLVKRIIEFHGGRIWIESEGNNRGATICFTLQAPPKTPSENE